MKKSWIFNILAILLSAVFGVFCASERLIARDEGFYAYAAQLVAEGKTPYHDFFFPQMPLTPYFYGLGGFLAGSSWEVYRMGSALCFIGILWLVYRIIARSSSRFVGLFALLATATCHLSFGWFPVIQTYALSTFLLLVGVYCLSQGVAYPTRSSSEIKSYPGWVLLSGVAFSLAAQARLFFLPLCVIPLFFLWNTPARQKSFSYFCSGVLLGSIPSFTLFFVSKDSFLFSNVAYHLHRSDLSFQDAVAGKWRIFEVLFALGLPSQKFSGFQTPILFGGLFLGLLSMWRFLPFAARLSGVVGVLLFFISFIPTPTYVQYFVTVIPFAVIVLFTSLSALLYQKKGLPRFIIGMGVVVCGIVYERHLFTDIERYTKSGTGVIGIGNERGAEDWNISKVQEIGQQIEDYTEPADVVLALWPGYLVGIERTTAKGSENHFGRGIVTERLSEIDQRRFHLLSQAHLESLLFERSISLVVGHRAYLSDELRIALKEHQYELREKRGEVEIYRSKS